jgi:hypothetical protein
LQVKAAEGQAGTPPSEAPASDAKKLAAATAANMA